MDGSGGTPRSPRNEGVRLARRWLALVVLLVAASLTWWYSRRSEPAIASNEIVYRGEKIKLSKSYDDFSTYKDDPDNIDPSETARVQTMVRVAPIAHSFSSRLDVFRSTGEIPFPGYGAGSGGGLQPDGSELLAVVIEIPRANQDRFIVFRGRNQRYELVDDFVHTEISYPFAIREQDGAYVYYGRQDKEVFRRPLQ